MIKKADALLKTEYEMRYDYSLADYPFDKSLYDYFVKLNQQSNQPRVNNKKAVSQNEVKELGKQLRDLFDKR